MHVTRSSRHQKKHDLLRGFSRMPALGGNGISIRQKSFALLMALMLLLQTVQWGGFVQHTAAAPVPDSVIKKVLLLQGEEFTESQLLGCFSSMDASCADLRAAVLNNGSTAPVYTDDFEASIGASSYPFTLAYEWAIDPTIANDGGTYTFTLPAQLKLESSMTGVSLGNAGTFDVDQATKTITMHFAAQTGPIQLEGGMQINAWLEETTVIVDNEILVRIPVSATAQIDVKLPVSFGNPTPNISKTMVSRDRAINTSKVNWSIDFNKNMGTINKAIIVDTLPNQLSLDETSINVVPLNYNIHTGVYSEGAPLIKDTNYSVANDSGSNQFTIDMSAMGTVKTAYRVYYASDVKSDATIPQYPGITLTNNVALFDDTASRATASANVTIQRGSTIEKSSTGYDSLNKHTATWSLDFNFGEFEFINPVLTDLLPAGHQLVPGSMIVQQVEINTNGSAGAVLDTLDEITDYTLVTNASGNATDKDEFDLTLLGTINKAYKIVYKTEAKDIAPVIDSGNKSNSLTTSVTTGTKSATVSYVHRLVYKSGEITDYAAKEMAWTIELNKNEYRFEEEGTHKVRLVDTFNNRGLRLIPGSLTITRKGSAIPLVEGLGNDYTLTSNTDGSQETGFTIEFDDNYLFDTEHTIKYDTKFDYEDYAAGSPWSPSNYRFQNTGEFFWGKITNSAGVALDGYEEDSQSASATITPNNHTRDNGYKNGSYDTRTKTTTWNVMFNYHNENVTGAIVSDTLQAGQAFDIADPSAIQIIRQNLAAGGGLTNGATLVRDTDYTVAYDTSGANPVLRVTFNGTISGPHLITFKTSMLGDLVPATINNTATLQSANSLYRATLTASVSPAFGNEFITKSFIHPDEAFKRLVEWSIWINRGRSHLNDIFIEDTPDQYQTLLQNEFKLYKATPTIANPSADSHFTLDLVDPGDYELEFLPVSAATPGHLKFTLEIDNSADHEAVYKLVYRSLLAAGTGNNITNQFTMSGWGSSVTSTSSQHTFPINKYSASGFSFPTGPGYDYLGEVTIQKQASDDNSIKLANAVFKIRPKFASGPVPDYTVTTNASGIATFEDLEYDVYEIIEVTAPSGYKLSTTPIEVVVNQPTQPTIVINNVVNTGVIGNYVWLDRDEDGIQDAGETGINGITVRLYKDGETTALETTTTANDGSAKPGYYLFDELAPGEYVVEFVVPDDYDLSPNVPGDPENDSNPINMDSKTGVITLNRANDFEDLTIDLGLIAKGSIGNYVWLDRNRDGLQDSEEMGINGIEVVLFKMISGVRTEITRTTTANHPTASTSGYYHFDHLTGGDYYVQFLVPSSYDKTTVEVGPDEEIDSNFTDGTGMTNVITIGPGNWDNPTIDLGLQGKGKIGDYVWFDTNDDGIQDSGEPGIENLIVELYNGTTLVASTRTDTDGGYLFDHLVEGNYYVKFETPSIYDFAKMGQGGDSSQDSNHIQTTGVDKGKTVNPIPIGPLSWEDMTIDLGFAGKGALGNYVWHDRNRNGIQDEDPMHGLNGVTVNLYRGTPGGVPFRTDTTKTEGGKPGYYGFTELPQGTYYVEFDFPAEYDKTGEEDDNDSATGSNQTDANHVTNAIEISETASPYGWVNPHIDLGLVAQGSIGNYVWFDVNRNGIQDATETGLNDVTLRLYKNSASGPVYAETVTTNGPGGKPGYYLFDNLASGDYFVEIVLDSNHETTEAEQGSGAGADELDSNKVSASNKTVAIEIGELAPKGWHDHTIDFGIVRKGAIGDYVWHDTDYNGHQDEDDEFGMNGVTVQLYDATKTLLATTVTASKDGKHGYYLFDHLVAGNYFVRFVNPLYYIPTKQGADGVSSSLDSNPTLEGFTESIAIGPVGPAVWRNLTIDQGYYYIPPVFPTPTPTPTPTTDPEATEEPSGTPTPGPTPTPTPGTATPKPTTTPSPTSTSITETTPEDTPIDVEVEVPKGGTTVPGTPPKHGTVVVTPDGKATYTPKPGYTGKDKFSVIVKDKDGNEEEFWFDIDVEEPPRGGLEGTPDVGNLPKTGQDSYLLLYLIGAAFIAFGIYIRVRNNRKTS